MEEGQKEKELNHSLKLIMKSSFIVLIGIFISKVFTYLYRVIIARTFEPSAYGLFSLAVIFVSVFSTIAALGMDSGILRFISLYRGKKEIDKSRYIFRFSFKVVFLSSILFGILLLLFSKFIAVEIFKNESLSLLLQYAGLFMPALSLIGIFLSALKAYEKIGWYSFLLNILVLFLQLTILIILLLFKAGENSIIFSYLLGYTGVFFISILVCKYQIPEIFSKSILTSKEKLNVRKEFFSYSLPIVFSGLSIILFTSIDSFFIGYFLDAGEVGIYNAAIPIAALLLVIPGLFTQLFFPLITKEFSKGNKEVIEQLSKQVSKWIFTLNLPFFILFILFPGAIINILFGAEYLAAENAFRFLSIGVFFYSSFSIISENLLSMAGKSKTILFNTLVSIILNITLSIVLTPKLGIEGAAISTMVAYICIGALNLIQSARKVKIIPIRRKMFSILFISCIPTTTLFFLRSLIKINILSIIFLAIFFFLLFFVLILITKSFDKNDIMILSTIKKKIKDNF
jgi:O-antigen/teichoic acid export membrane protein